MVIDSLYYIIYTVVLYKISYQRLECFGDPTNLAVFKLGIINKYDVSMDISAKLNQVKPEL